MLQPSPRLDLLFVFREVGEHCLDLPMWNFCAGFVGFDRFVPLWLDSMCVSDTRSGLQEDMRFSWSYLSPTYGKTCADMLKFSTSCLQQVGRQEKGRREGKRERERERERAEL